MRFLLSIVLAAAVCLLPVVSAYLKSQSANDDEVTHLPGLANPLPFKHYSGYLPVNSQKNIHYWFFESQNDPDNDPVAMWTNGGPGCSGLIGLFEEHGPFRVGSDGNLIVQLSTSWNAVSNFIYFEQPVGVGFSYSTNPKDYHTGDAQAAADNLAAILQFFIKFPGLAKNKFIITSESYGGHYMPTLASAIVKYNAGSPSQPLNFDGFLVGNPLTNSAENLLGKYGTFCGKNLASHPVCAGIRLNCYPYPGNDLCEWYELDALLQIGNLDPYALDFPVCLSNAQRVRLNEFIYRKNPKLLKLLNAGYNPCEEDYETSYLNRPDVQKALHVQPTTDWEACTIVVNYNETDTDASMDHYYTDLMNATKGTLHMTVFSGDDDSVCGTLGTQDWMFGLNLTVKSPWVSWIDNAGQVGGYIVKWEGGLTLVTVHTAGHEVAAFQPDRAFTLWKNYLAKIW